MWWIKLEIKQRGAWIAAAMVCACVMWSLTYGAAQAQTAPQTAPSLEDPLAALQREIANSPVEAPVETLAVEVSPAEMIAAPLTAITEPMDVPPPRRTMGVSVEEAAPLAGFTAQTRVWAAAIGVPSATLTFALAMVAAMTLGTLAAAFTHRAPVAARARASRETSGRPAPEQASRPAGPNLERLKQSIRDDWPRGAAESANAPPAPSASDILTQAADHSAAFETPQPPPPAAPHDALSHAMFGPDAESDLEPSAPTVGDTRQTAPLSAALQRLSERKQRVKPQTPPPVAAEEPHTDEEAFDAVMKLLMEEDDDAPSHRPSPRADADLELVGDGSGSAAAVLRRAQGGAARQPAE